MTKRFKLSVNGPSSAKGRVEGSRTLPISFGRKLESTESGTDGKDEAAAEETVLEEVNDGNITSTAINSPLSPDLSTGAPVAKSSSSSSRFATLRKWFKPWKWRRSKRNGEMRSKGAEMEDVDGIGATVVANRPSERILNQSLSDTIAFGSGQNQVSQKSSFPILNDTAVPPISVADVKLTLNSTKSSVQSNSHTTSTSSPVVKKGIRIQESSQATTVYNGKGDDGSNSPLRGPRDSKNSPVAQNSPLYKYTTETSVVRSQPLVVPAPVNGRNDSQDSPKPSSLKSRLVGFGVAPDSPRNGSPVINNFESTTPRFAAMNGSSSGMEGNQEAQNEGSPSKLTSRRRQGIVGEAPTSQLVRKSSPTDQDNLSPRNNASGDFVASRFGAVPAVIETPADAKPSSAFVDNDDEQSDESTDSFDESDSDNETTGLGKKVMRKDSLAIHLEAKRTGRRLSEVRVGREVVPGNERKAELSEIGNRLQRKLSLRPTAEDLAQRNILREDEKFDMKERRESLARKLSFRPTIEQLKELKIIRFNDYVEMSQVEEWDRRADKPWTRLTPKDKAAIRKELNDFKKEEMEVHEQSKQYTRFHRP
ncbi:hypothetical protein RvY_10296 [Ramazzottius varieornatus]|uniref:Phosphatase and actin regulator n=1 Tax=Ramazzottius varieornatus TaxID=947166 RepID=A0A1D1VEF0_RAMVA|nr:hypothetical protein RvY_10296 [Ramazzottius varieornatus]